MLTPRGSWKSKASDYAASLISQSTGVPRPIVRKAMSIAGDAASTYSRSGFQFLANQMKRTRSDASMASVKPSNRFMVKGISKRGPPRINSRVKMSNRRNRLRVFQGTYRSAGRFARGKPKRSKVSKYNMKGSVKVAERRGVATDSQCLYIGHGVAPTEALYSACRGVIKKLFQKGGLNVVNFQNTPIVDTGKAFQLKIAYSPRAPAQNIFDANIYMTTTGTIGATNVPISYDTFAQNFANLIRTETVSRNTDDKAVLQIFSIELYLVSYNGGSPTTVPMSTLEGDQLFLEIDVTSTLQIQNRTLASTGTNGVEQLATNIENNPLRGKIYYSKKWGNAIQLNYRQTGLSNFTGLIVDPLEGIFTESGTDMANQSTDSKYMFQKPPPAWMFNAMKSSNISLAPGRIKYDSVKFKAKLKFNTFLSKINKLLCNADLDELVEVPFGKLHMLAFEKLMDTGEDGEPSVDIGYEITQTYKSFVTERKRRSAPIVFIEVPTPP